MPQDLWNALQNYTGSSLPNNYRLEDVMSKWTEQPGYPVLQVALSGADAVITQVGVHSEFLKNKINIRFGKCVRSRYILSVSV